MDAVCRDYRTAPISDKEKVLFAYLERLSREPASLRREHADALKAVGWSDAAIYDAVTVCAMFHFFNRWIDGNGVEDTPPGFYAERLERHGDRGYA